MQYFQIPSIQPHDFYSKNLQELESAWSLVETHPKYMDTIQSQVILNDYTLKVD